MRVLWISFLLLGSITCYPEEQGSEGEQPWWWSVSSSGYDSHKQSEKPAGPRSGFGSYPGQYYSGITSAGGDDGSYMVQQHGGPHDRHHGAPGMDSPYQSTEESWSSSSDTSGEDEPVFTPVEDQDEVYAFKSRSRYNRKRLSFNQFRYTPTEPRFSREPVFHHGQRHHHQHPVKTGY